jgi:hypothetical protein
LQRPGALQERCRSRVGILAASESTVRWTHHRIVARSHLSCRIPLLFFIWNLQPWFALLSMPFPSNVLQCHLGTARFITSMRLPSRLCPSGQGQAQPDILMTTNADVLQFTPHFTQSAVTSCRASNHSITLRIELLVSRTRKETLAIQLCCKAFSPVATSLFSVPRHSSTSTQFVGKESAKTLVDERKARR